MFDFLFGKKKAVTAPPRRPAAPKEDVPLPETGVTAFPEKARGNVTALQTAVTPPVVTPQAVQTPLAAPTAPTRPVEQRLPQAAPQARAAMPAVAAAAVQTEAPIADINQQIHPQPKPPALSVITADTPAAALPAQPAPVPADLAPRKRWQDTEITNEESLHVEWKTAKLINIDREMREFSEKGTRNYALIQSNASTIVLMVTRTQLADDAGMGVLLSLCTNRPHSKIEKLLVSPSVLAHTIERLTSKNATTIASVKEADSDEIRAFEEIAKAAILTDASDIHFVGDSEDPRIEFRVLGVICQSGLSYSYTSLKNLVRSYYATQAEKGSNKGSAINFETQQRAAYEMSLEINGKHELFKLRFEVGPTLDGFHATARIAKMSGDAVKIGPTLEGDLLKRGYLPDQARQLRLKAYKNGGSIILMGQTGSGKTQSLYNIVRHIAVPEKRTFSVEDPIEGKLHKVRQIQVKQKEGESEDEAVTRIMKSLLRQDPDTALISELRGKESASGFQQIVESGHKTLTTVHASNAIGGYNRLASDKFGLDRGFLSEPDRLSILVHQNLVQVICPECGLSHDKAGISYEYMKLIEAACKTRDVSSVRFRNPQGCPTCAKSPIKGVFGREVAASIWVPEEETLLLLREKKTLEAYKEFRSRRKPLYEADSEGKSAMEVAIYKMLSGHVDPREVEGIFESFEEYIDTEKRFH